MKTDMNPEIWRRRGASRDVAPGGARRCLETPLGRLVLTAAGGALVEINWVTADGTQTGGLEMVDGGLKTPERQVLDAAEDWLRAYLTGGRAAPDFPLDPRGTPFQIRVWQRIQAIPHGQTATYGAIAAALGQPRGARAIGAACGRNPLPLVIPCHRVLASNGGMGGYSGAGGLETKTALLALETGATGATGAAGTVASAA